MRTKYEVSFIGDSKEIPVEQHYKLISKDHDLIIFACTENEAIEFFLVETDKASI